MSICTENCWAYSAPLFVNLYQDNFLDKEHEAKAISMPSFIFQAMSPNKMNTQQCQEYNKPHCYSPNKKIRDISKLKLNDDDQCQNAAGCDNAEKVNKPSTMGSSQQINDTRQLSQQTSSCYNKLKSSHMQQFNNCHSEIKKFDRYKNYMPDSSSSEFSKKHWDEDQETKIGGTGILLCDKVLTKHISHQSNNVCFNDKEQLGNTGNGFSTSKIHSNSLHSAEAQRSRFQNGNCEFEGKFVSPKNFSKKSYDQLENSSSHLSNNRSALCSVTEDWNEEDERVTQWHEQGNTLSHFSSKNMTQSKSTDEGCNVALPSSYNQCETSLLNNNKLQRSSNANWTQKFNNPVQKDFRRRSVNFPSQNNGSVHQNSGRTNNQRRSLDHGNANGKDCFSSSCSDDLINVSPSFTKSLSDKEVSYLFGQVAKEMNVSSEPFIDTHCHIDFIFRKLNYKQSFSKFMMDCQSSAPFPSNFEGCVSVFCEPNTFWKSRWWQEIVENKYVWGAFGCHPHHADKFGRSEEEHLRKCLQHPKTVAIGEMGLDYSYKNNVSHKVQQNVFRTQLKIAKQVKKPVIIHCRDAYMDCLEILAQELDKNYLIHRHCFTGDSTEAQLCMKLYPKMFFGFTCLITKRGLHSLREAVKIIPLNRILLETDGPYFSPFSIANKITVAHPGMAIYVAKEIAFIKNCSLSEVLTAARKNTKTVYNI